MTAEVITLPTPERLIWVCGCGCSTFNLFADGVSACSVCGKEQVGAPEGWQKDTFSARERETPIPAMSDHQGNGEVGFALALIRKVAMSEAANMIIVAEENSRVRVWSKAETREQMDWMFRRLQDAKELLETWEFEK